MTDINQHEDSNNHVALIYDAIVDAEWCWEYNLPMHALAYLEQACQTLKDDIVLASPFSPAISDREIPSTENTMAIAIFENELGQILLTARSGLVWYKLAQKCNLHSTRGLAFVDEEHVYYGYLKKSYQHFHQAITIATTCRFSPYQRPEYQLFFGALHWLYLQCVYLLSSIPQTVKHEHDFFAFESIRAIAPRMHSELPLERDGNAILFIYERMFGFLYPPGVDVDVAASSRVYVDGRVFAFYEHFSAEEYQEAVNIFSTSPNSSAWHERAFSHYPGVFVDLAHALVRVLLEKGKRHEEEENANVDGNAVSDVSVQANDEYLCDILDMLGLLSRDGSQDVQTPMTLTESIRYFSVRYWILNLLLGRKSVPADISLCLQQLCVVCAEKFCQPVENIFLHWDDEAFLLLPSVLIQP